MAISYETRSRIQLGYNCCVLASREFWVLDKKQKQKKQTKNGIITISALEEIARFTLEGISVQ
jgi:hypothetical protein